MNEYIADKIISYLQVEKNSKSEIKIRFYIETILSEIEKLIAIIIIFSSAGYTPDIIIIMCTIIMIRKYLGGTHCKTGTFCFINTLVMCAIPILIARLVSVNLIASYFISLLLIIYIIHSTPITSKFRPKYTGRRLFRIKVKCICMIFLIDITYIFLDKIFQTEITIVMIELLFDNIYGKKGGTYEKNNIIINDYGDSDRLLI